MTWHLRFHGRGGEGVKLASRIVSRAAFESGQQVQDAPLYGAERRGAPVVAFTRISKLPIRERGYIDVPDAVVVMDASLLTQPDAGVLSGATEQCLILLNTSLPVAEIRRRTGTTGRIEALDVSSRALALLGKHLLSAPMASFALKAAGLARWERIEAAVRRELRDIGVGPAMIETNVKVAREIYEIAPRAALLVPPVEAPPRSVLARVPLLAVRLGAPAVDRAANSALASRQGWRVFRPEIDQTGCTRCLLCFALCPEGAIHLTGDGHPVIDYEHCKGCLVCAHECPTHTIHETREAAA